RRIELGKPMTATAITLLAAHLLGDFVLQTDRMVERKRSPWVLLLHVVIVAGLSAALLGAVPPALMAVLFLSHLAMDALKVFALPSGASAFLADQAVHLAVIAGLAVAFPDAALSGVWAASLGDAYSAYLQVLAVAIGLLLAVPAGGVMIGLLLRPLTAELDAEMGPGNGLTHGGRYIGWLERALTLLLFLAGQASAVGFVIATKSILRFGEIKDSKHRKLAEYIIIGTFLSFAWAIVCGLLTQRMLTALS
ncbi:MAG: DUF3307 domain-containing protein, partial [Ectothiorhodospiraceae bacterium]